MPSRKGSEGFNLIEVIIALGLLTGVLVSIASMFALAQFNVKSGKELTEATSIAQHVMEDLNGMSYNGVRKTLSPSTPILTTNGPHVFDSSDPADVYPNTNYQPLVDERLWKGRAEIELTPLGVNPKVALGNFEGEALRIKVTVFWSEMNRDRSVSLTTIRF